jgi:hypothetical protein
MNEKRLRIRVVRILFFLAVPVLLLGALGCVEADTSPKEIDDVRTVTAPRAEGEAMATSAARLGLTPESAVKDAHAGHNHAPGEPHDHGEEDSPFVFAVPEGWEELPTQQFRPINLAMAGQPDAQLYVSILPNQGGGRLANLNRWRDQMSLPPLSHPDVEALPRITLFRQSAVMVDLEGTFKGMSAQESRPDWKLLGALTEMHEISVFVKMTGPAAVLADQTDAFKDFCASLQLAGAESSDPHAGHSHGQSATDDQGRTPTETLNPANMFWEVPEGWVKGADRTMRLLTLHPAGSKEAECYLTVLPGSAGGMEANVNRWQQQMGHAPLTPDAIAALPELRAFGEQYPYVEVSGTYSDGMSGKTIDDATLIGTVIPFQNVSLFIKFVGPADLIEAERGRFLSFCLTLE